jgi:uncharacterized protein (DUF1330 family)
MALVLDFESKDAISAMLESDEYKALVPAREQGFARMTVNLGDGMRSAAP